MSILSAFILRIFTFAIIISYPCCYWQCRPRLGACRGKRRGRRWWTQAAPVGSETWSPGHPAAEHSTDTGEIGERRQLLLSGKDKILKLIYQGDNWLIWCEQEQEQEMTDLHCLTFHFLTYIVSQKVLVSWGGIWGPFYPVKVCLENFLSPVIHVYQ